MFPVRPRTLAAACFALILADAHTTVAAEDFRIENKVFYGSRRKPISESTTIFHDGLVYDYMQDPPEVIVLDKAGGRFVLLDTIRRVRAELTTDDVATFVRQLQRVAPTQNDPLKQFLADPHFEEQFDESTDELTLSSRWMTYRVLIEPRDEAAIANQYRDFADWYVRLNTLLNPGSKPPFARLLVNTALHQRQATPREVHLTMDTKRIIPPTRVKAHSQHKFVHEVAGADLDRITQTRQFMDIFKQVSFDQYRRAKGR